VGSVTPAWKLLSVKLPLPPLLNVGWLHQTAWEKLIVTLEAPTAPDAETMVGAPVGELVAVAVCACGATIVLPAASMKLVLQVVAFTQAPVVLEGLTELKTFRSTSTNAPGGIDVARNKFAVVTPFVGAVAVLQTGVLSAVTASGVANVTFFTVQSLGACAALN